MGGGWAGDVVGDIGHRSFQQSPGVDSLRWCVLSFPSPSASVLRWRQFS